jgi:hypothetical protein
MVSFQQAVNGYPLDDIVVHALNADGSPAILEVQSKRELTFTLSDTKFKEVVAQMWAASKKQEFSSSRYELAVAIAKTTARIEAEYQEVLFWARELPDAVMFAAHIARSGFSSAGMRGFVSVFKNNLKAAGAPDDDQLVWSILRRFQILVFDFQSHGADHSHFAGERCRAVLTPEQSARSADLWAILSNAAMQSAAAAGAKNHAALVTWLTTEHGFAFGPRADLRVMHSRLKSEAKNALADIKYTVGGIRLARAACVGDGLSAIESHKALAIVGAPGTGKSAVLKRVAQLQEAESTIIFLSRGRIVQGGGLAWAQAVSCPLLLDELFNELGCGGGATLFVDNIDQIDDQNRLVTVNDLVRTAIKSPGWRVAFTAADTRAEWLTRFPAITADTMATVVVGEIDDEEAAQLSAANTSLFAILDPNHPARGLARNLFLLSRMFELSTGGGLTGIAKEIDLAGVWWRYGGGRSEDNRVARQRLLRTMGSKIVADPAVAATRTDELDSSTVEELLLLDAIREHQPNFSVAFRHDVLRDWTIGFLLHNDPALLDTLAVSQPISEALARPLEFAARLALDDDDTGNRWLSLLSKFDDTSLHGTWRRPILLALTRSEHAFALLEKLNAQLLANEGRLLVELLRLMQSVETQPLKLVLQQLQPSLAMPAGAGDFMLPKGNGWTWLALWITTRASDLPPTLIPDAARLFQTWLISTHAQASPIHMQAMRVLYDWLIRIDQSLDQTVVRSIEDIRDPEFTFPHMRQVRDDIRTTFFNCCHLTPDLAEQYLKSLDSNSLRYGEAQKIIYNPGALTKAAPSALTDFTLSSLIEEENDDDPYRNRRSDYGPFMGLEPDFSAASPGQQPFLEMLLNSPKDGLRLVRGIVAHATQWWRSKYDDDRREFPKVTVPFPDGPRTFVGDARVYAWSRSEVPSTITTSALMALEAWGHREIEAGRPFHDVLGDIIGDDGSSIAFLAVAVDLALSHWRTSHPTAWPLLASPELLRYDDWRYKQDIGGANDMRLRLRQESSNWKVKRADLEAKPSRQHRLWDRIGEYAIGGPKVEAKALRAALEAANTRIAGSNIDDGDPVEGLKACAKRAWRMSDPANWLPVTVTLQDGTQAQRLQFEQDAEETAHREVRATTALNDLANTSTRITIQNALFDVTKSTPEVVAEAIKWAKAKQAAPVVISENDDRDEKFDRSWDDRAVIMAAALAVRDSDADDQGVVSAWALSVLSKAAATESTEYRHNPQVQYNGQAIAVMGLLQLYKKTQTSDLRDRILTLCTSHDPAVRNALGSEFSALTTVAPDLVRSMIRIMLTNAAFVRNFYPVAEKRHKAELATKIATRIDREKSWLSEGDAEPNWPALPNWTTRKRRGVRIGGPAVIEPDETPPIVVADEHALGELAQHLVPLTIGDSSVWLIELADRLMKWTDPANGRHGQDERDRDNRPTVWNAAFFDFLGVLSVALPHGDVITKYLRPMAGFNDEAFFDCAAGFLRGFDRAAYAPDTLKSDNPTAIRVAIADRMKQSRSFKRLAREKSFTSESHLADLLSAFFYHPANLTLSNRPSFPLGWGGISETMGTLTDLVIAAPTSGYLATALLNVLDAARRPELLPFVVKVLSAWGSAYGVNTNFWLERDIGPRVCAWLDQILVAASTATIGTDVRAELSQCLDVMIRSGVGQARGIEAKLEGAFKLRAD